ncbi:hypothetical protein [Parvibaculum sp.]|jgi:hypothetical protein|uniref:hypothetical protein n=1 Tax=Parvibaculum sp. TaxID=2024848 RepID=UPI002FD8F3DA
MQKEITLKRFAGIVDAYGASPRRWPDDERASAEALVAASAEARALLAEAAALDGVLARAPVEAPSAALAERLLAARPRGVAAVPSPKPQAGFIRSLIEAVWPYGSPAVPAGALAASIVLGVTLGSISDISVLTQETAVTASVESGTEDSLVALALAEPAWPEEWMQ